jgi:two-component system response regulator HydG
MPKSRVLIVDDSSEMVQAISKYLTAHGFDTAIATSGDDALEEVRATPPDAIITDLRMDGLDGLDVLEIVRKEHPEMPVVIMTAFGSVESAVEATHRGAFHYLVKPFKLAALRAILETAVGDQPRRPQVPSEPPAPGAVATPVAASFSASDDPFVSIARAGLPLREVESRYTSAVLRSVGGNKTRAAEILGVDPSTLYRRERRNESS